MKPNRALIGRNCLTVSDACVAPVLQPSEVSADFHMKTRGTIRDIGGILQAVAAPRFDGVRPSDPKTSPKKGEHTEEILMAVGVDPERINACRGSGAM